MCAVIANLERIDLVEKQGQFNCIGDNTSNLYIVKLMPGACHSPPDTCGTPKLYSFNDIQSNGNQSSITEKDGLERLKAKIDYSWFEEEMPDKLGFIDNLFGYIFELEQDVKPETIRLLANINELVVIEFLDGLKGRSFANVKNLGGRQRAEKEAGGFKAACEMDPRANAFEVLIAVTKCTFVAE